MDGGSLSTEIVVRFAETDAQAIAHHASFVVWLEVARVAYLAEHAGGYNAIRAQGVAALKTGVEVRYPGAAAGRGGGRGGPGGGGGGSAARPPGGAPRARRGGPGAPPAAAAASATS